MQSSNPVLREDKFRTVAVVSDSPGEGGSSVSMTMYGAIAKSAFLVFLLFAAGCVSWLLVVGDFSGTARPDQLYRTLFGIGAPVLAFFVGMGIAFAPRISPIAAPVYAVLEGLFLGAVSSFFEGMYRGLVLEAVLLTVGVLAAMLFFYCIRWIVVTRQLVTGILSATIGIMLTYLVSSILNLCGVPFPYIHDNGILGIGFSFLVVGVAAFNLILDFDAIENASRSQAPKYMEWYAAYGLLVTLIWLYIQILSLLAKLRSKD